MVDKTRQGGAVILKDDSNKKQNSDGTITEGHSETESETSEEDSDDSKEYGEDVLYCESCGFSQNKSESSWFPGDACPKCKGDYLSAD